MSDTQGTAQNNVVRAVGRRGMIAAAAMVAAGALAQQTAEPVAAYSSGSIPYADAMGNLTEDNANLRWGATNKQLVVGAGVSLNPPSTPIPQLLVGVGSPQKVQNPMVGIYPSRRLEVVDGASGAEITTPGATVRISRVENVPSSIAGGNQGDNEANAAFVATSIGTSTSQMQSAAILGQATISSTVSMADAVGLFGFGGVTGSGVGVGRGAYVEGRRDTTTGDASGLEVRAQNATTSSEYYDVSNFPRVSGLWLTCQTSKTLPAAICGPGIALAGLDSSGNSGSPTSSTWHVGIGFTQSSIASVPPSNMNVESAAVRDDSGAYTSYSLSGTHTYGIDAASSAISRSVIRFPNNKGASALNHAGTTDVSLITLDASDRVVIGDSNASGTTVIGGIQATAATRDAVTGSSTSGNGVVGTSNTGVGIYGISAGGSGSPFGVVGVVSSAAPGFGLYGLATVPGTVAFAGGSSVSGGIAGQFSGPVNVYGTLTLLGNGNAFVAGPGVSKNAAVNLPDGSVGLMHCVEAPEPWFEDFGKGMLAAGRAEVKLDSLFAGTVDTTTLHVFLTPHDEAHNLHLTGTNGATFTVSASPSSLAVGKRQADLNGTFTYRVVAKRKDVKGERLARVTLPKEIKLTPPPIPPMPNVSRKQ